jgi:endonuclease/exonuclease/phosphatase (EEP) superfamily protein YafD
MFEHAAAAELTAAPAAEPEAAPGRRCRWGVWQVSALFLALVHPLARLLARWDWRADALTNLQGPAACVTAIATMILLRKHRLVAAAVAVLLAIQMEPLVRYWAPSPMARQPPTGARLRILMANVLVLNPYHDALAEVIRRERPDVVGLVEVTPEWLGGLDLEGVRAEFPYRRELPIGARGIALWLRQRPRALAVPEVFSDDGNPVLSATIDLDGRPLRLWLVHPPNPLFLPPSSNRDLSALGAAVGRAGGSQVVVGDLNRAEFSPFYDDFVRLSGLRDSRYGFGPQPSWPSDYPLRIAIDHAFVSGDLTVTSRRLGPHIGSDHLPLIVDVCWASKAATNSSAQRAQSSSP